MKFLIPNHAKNTTAAPAGVTTGTAIKTMLQILPLVPLKLKGWEFSFDGTPADIKIELIEVDVAATVTALVDADITRLDDISDGVASSLFMTLSTIGTGYTSSGEGTVTAVRNLVPPKITSVKNFVQPFALGEEPTLQVGKYTRIRVTAASAVNMLCSLIVATG